MSRELLLLILFSLAITFVTADLSCLDRQGNPVAWFTFIKFPGNLTVNAPRYAYLDANSGSNYQVISGAHCDHPEEALPKTIDTINRLSVMYANKLVFSDQPPESNPSSSGGHAKGILAFDNQTQTGVYITHSFPKFPSVSEDGEIQAKTPDNTLRHGQNAYCISLDKETFYHVLDTIPIKQPNVYYSSGLFKYTKWNPKERHAIRQFNLLNGDDQWLLTKHARHPGFLFEDIISPYFNVSLLVESWGRPYQDSHCHPSGRSSLNILRVGFSEKDSWSNTNDHSKWTITTGETGLKLACLCDLNRMESQKSRGGSCLCSPNQNLYNALKSIIVVTEDECIFPQTI